MSEESEETKTPSEETKTPSEEATEQSEARRSLAAEISLVALLVYLALYIKTKSIEIEKTT